MSEVRHFNDVLDKLVRGVELGDAPIEAHVLIAAAEHFSRQFPGLQVFDGMPTAHDCFVRIAAARKTFERNARRMARQVAA